MAGPTAAVNGDPEGRVTWVVHWGAKGSGPLFAAELASALAQSGVPIRLSIDSAIGDSLALPKDLPLHEIHKRANSPLIRTAKLLSAYVKTWRQLRRDRTATVIVAMESPSQTPFWLAASFLLREYTVIIHDGVLRSEQQTRRMRLSRYIELSRASRVITLSQDVTNALVRNGLKKPITTLFHPAFTPRQRPNPGKTLRSPCRVGLVGRLDPYKGVSLFCELADLWEGPETFTVCGSGPSETEITSPKVERILGWISDETFPDVVGGFDVIVLPYTEASQSGVIAWAWATAVPVIVTPVGGLAHQVSSTSSGVVAERVTAPALKSALLRLLNEPGLYQKLAEGAAQASESHSWQAFAEKLISPS